MQRSLITAGLCAGFAIAGLMLGGWSHAGPADRIVNAVPVAPKVTTSADLLGTYVLAVTASNGIYSKAHLAPDGMTNAIMLVADGSWVGLFNYSTETTIWLEPVSSTSFKGYDSYETWTSLYGWIDVAEAWTLSVSNGVISLKVETTDNIPRLGAIPKVPVSTSPSGSYAGRFHDTVPLNDFGLSADWYSSNRGATGALDTKFIGEGNVFEWYDWSNNFSAPKAAKVSSNNLGVYGYLYFDGATEWDEDFYISSFYRDGNKLIGSGWYENYNNITLTGQPKDFVANDWREAFAVITVTLDSSGKPVSSSTKGIIGYDKNQKPFSITSGTYVNATVQAAKYPYASRNIVVTNVTRDGILQDRFGSKGTGHGGWIYQGPNYQYFAIYNGSNWINLYAGDIANGKRTWTLWGPSQYREGGYPSWDLDYANWTQERQTIEIFYDKNNLPIKGIITLKSYYVGEDGALHTQASESVTFEITTGS